MDLLRTNTDEMVMEVNGSSGCTSCMVVEVIISRERQKRSSRAKALALLGRLWLVQGACR